MANHYVGKKGLIRFPRIKDSDEVELRKLVVDGHLCFDRRREANLELGRIFRRIKKIVGHGQWENFYQFHFPNCVSPRTARAYMRLARKEDANLKTAKSAVFKTGGHDTALKMKAATSKAKAEIDPQKFRIVLSVPVDQQDAVRRLQRSSEWPKAEAEILAILNRHVQSSEVPNENSSA